MFMLYKNMFGILKKKSTIQYVQPSHEYCKHISCNNAITHHITRGMKRSGKFLKKSNHALRSIIYGHIKQL